MSKLSTQLAVVGTATAMALVFVGAPMEVRAAPATNVFCGDNIAQSTKLNGDVTCSGNSVFIVADNVTLDLGGFTISGVSGTTFAGVVIVKGPERVTIKNGTIQGFQEGVLAVTPLNLKISDLILKNNTQVGVITVDGGENVVIRNSSFLAPAASSCVAATSAIRFNGVINLDVNNVDVHGGTTAVQIDCGPCDGSRAPNTGKIRNSTFTETHVGMFIGNTTDLTISNNHFSNIVPTLCDTGDAITVAPVGPEPRTGIKIRNNLIHDNFNGILLFGVVAGAEIKENQVRDNSDVGIGLFEIGVPSTGNLIKNNITSGNGVDLLHDMSSSPNTWKNNSCETRSGDDIPAC